MSFFGFYDITPSLCVTPQILASSPTVGLGVSPDVISGMVPILCWFIGWKIWLLDIKDLGVDTFYPQRDAKRLLGWKKLTM